MPLLLIKCIIKSTPYYLGVHHIYSGGGGCEESAIPGDIDRFWYRFGIHCERVFKQVTRQAQRQPKMPEVITLGKDAKLGQVTFNHVKHNGGTYSIDQTGPIE